MNRVPGELIIKLLREADRALGSESAYGNYSTWSAIGSVPSKFSRRIAAE